MGTSQLTRTLQHLRTVMLRRDGTDATDGALLDLFITHRDEAAFEALVQRHGPMVLGVCRRVLHNAHDAEDAFQATFLILVRRAASIRPRNMVGNWLYGVAYRTALEARRAAARRRAKERQVMAMPRSEPAHDLWEDVRPVLDQELARLPEHYRAVLVLCDVEGKTRKEAARQFGWAEGTVASRLARGRVLLAKRLARRGVALSGGALAWVLSEHAASACMPGSLVSGTVKAASLLAAGQAATTSVVSTNVAALMKGVLQGMFISKLKTTTILALAVVLAGAGACLLTRQAFAAGQGAAAEQGNAKATDGKPREAATITIKDVELDELDGGQRTLTGTIGRKPTVSSLKGVTSTIVTPKLDLRPLKITLDLATVTAKEPQEVKGAKQEVKPSKQVLETRALAAQALGKAPQGTLDAQVFVELLTVKPTARLMNVPIAADAKISIGRKEVALTDLKPGMHVSVQLAARENGLVIVGITIGE